MAVQMRSVLFRVSGEMTPCLNADYANGPVIRKGIKSQDRVLARQTATAHEKA